MDDRQERIDQANLESAEDYVAGPICCARAGCSQPEDRIDGYCSIYCRDLAEVKEEALMDAQAARLAGAIAMQETCARVVMEHPSYMPREVAAMIRALPVGSTAGTPAPWCNVVQRGATTRDVR